MSTELEKRLLRLIEAGGPISVSQYMHFCMADPEYGYYQQNAVIGKAGDFITAPQVSQMFGELIGIWCIHVWEKLGKPDRIHLIELGPGLGTLMGDLLRAAQSAPDFIRAVSVTMVETSTSLTSEQKARLNDAHPRINWIDNLEGAFDVQPTAPCIVVANEFLDVIPFRQFVKSKNNWQERVVGKDSDHDRLTYFLGQGHLDSATLPMDAHRQADGAVFEYAPAREALVQQVAGQIKARTGAALFVDYGHARSGFGDTFQAIHDHKYVDTLYQPGKVDLTSHVDFEPLGLMVAKETCHPYKVISQGEFLLGLGLLERAGYLGATQSTKHQEALKQQVERLAHPDQMGNLFKCFSFSHEDLGLEPFGTFDNDANKVSNHD